MRSETQQASGPRRRRGGRRHRSHRHSRGSSAANNTARTTASKSPAKLGFFQRILAFFTRKKPLTPGKVYGKVLDGSNDETNKQTNNNNRAPAATPTPQKPVRKPELLEVTSPKLYVGNLSFDAVESDLTELFAGVGKVQNSEVVSHRETHKSKGFGFVTMSSIEEAKRAVLELHDKEFMGRRLVVSGAKTSDVR